MYCNVSRAIYWNTAPKIINYYFYDTLCHVTCMGRKFEISDCDPSQLLNLRTVVLYITVCFIIEFDLKSRSACLRFFCIIK